MSNEEASISEYSHVECRHYDVDGELVHCRLCPHECAVPLGKTGICRARMNVSGRLILTTYGACSSIHVDPIEKKPLFHFYPGRQILSLGSLGCNLKCRFCQNWQISQSSVGTRFISPRDAVEMAAAVSENLGIAYTYNEPLMWYEYLMDTAPLVRDAGMLNVLVTNGEINEGPLRELLPFIDAMNVDVKSMDDDFYRKLCGGPLAPVLRTVGIAREFGVHLEVTNLLIPGMNDGTDQIRRLVDWLADIDPAIPLHITRYHPDYKMSEPPATPPESLIAARDSALRRLRHVYVGNMHIPGAEDTICPHCGLTVISRMGHSILSTQLDGGKCSKCGASVDIVS